MVPLNSRCRNIIYNQKGPVILGTTHLLFLFLFIVFPSYPFEGKWDEAPCQSSILTIQTLVCSTLSLLLELRILSELEECQRSQWFRGSGSRSAVVFAPSDPCGLFKSGESPALPFAAFWACVEAADIVSYRIGNSSNLELVDTVSYST